MWTKSGIKQNIAEEKGDTVFCDREAGETTQNQGSGVACNSWQRSPGLDVSEDASPGNASAIITTSKR